jgi:hypothetical protein
MIAWGFPAGAMAFVAGSTGFIVMRFLLGIAEAGSFPDVILNFNYWFPEAYRGRVPRSDAAAAFFCRLAGHDKKGRASARRVGWTTVQRKASGPGVPTKRIANVWNSLAYPRGHDI